VPDSTLTESIAITLDVVRVFRDLGISYLVGGSLASSIHGKPRSTDDVDLVATIRRGHVDALVRAWGDDYYADSEMIREAIDRRSSFNIIHLATMLKVDVFVPGDDPFSAEEMARARPVRVGDDPGAELVLASPEDTVLQKLRWYRLGGEVSERQWRDVLGVLQVAGPKLDHAYVRHWAPRLRIEDLLERAIAESAPR
jgi:hypothetical protein